MTYFVLEVKQNFFNGFAFEIEQNFKLNFVFSYFSESIFCNTLSFPSRFNRIQKS